MPHAFDPESLRSVHLVPLTAYNSAGQIDSEKQAAHAARMYAAGIRAFLPAAGTSEFHSLSAEEIVQLVEATCAGVSEDAVVFAPVGLQLAHAVDVARRSVAAGATGIMFMPFSHPYLSDVGAREYYHTVLDAVDCPALVYKKGPIPSNGLLLELAAHRQVVGVKYAVNEMHEFRKVILKDTAGIEWICGSAERFAPYYMLAGSPGYTTGAGNVCPRLTLAMHAAFTAGEFAEGMRLQQVILPIEDFRARAGDSYNISMLKHALKLTGSDFGPPRPPQRALASEEEAEIAELLKPILQAEEELASELRTVGLA